LIGNAVRILAETPSCNSNSATTRRCPRVRGGSRPLESPFRYLLRATFHDTSIGA
jgi:hypothetical protein